MSAASITLRDAAILARNLFAGLPPDQRDAMLKLLADVETYDGAAYSNIAEFMLRWAEEDQHATGVVAELWVRFHIALREIRGASR